MSELIEEQNDTTPHDAMYSLVTNLAFFAVWLLCSGTNSRLDYIRQALLNVSWSHQFTAESHVTLPAIGLRS